MPTLGETLAGRRRSGKGSLLAYLMGGTLPRERYLEAVDRLTAIGVTGLEVGFPFSDPIAEGPVIQRAATEALSRDFHWADLLDLVPETSRRLPTAVMTYLNVFEHRGIGPSLTEIGAQGVSAVIVPDLPVEEADVFRNERGRTGIDTVLLASPGAPPTRVKRIARRTEGFLYLVSRYGTTGVTNEKALDPSRPAPELSGILKEVRTTRPRLPVLVGFGVSRPEDVRRYRTLGADGVVVGSAFQALLGPGGSLKPLEDLAGDLVHALEVSDG